MALKPLRPGGRDADAPELKIFQTKPYDAFRLNVFTVENIFSKEFEKASCNVFLHEGPSWSSECIYVIYIFQAYHGLGFLADLTDMMMISDFHQECTAQDAPQSKIPAWSFWRRLDVAGFEVAASQLLI